MTTPSSLPKTMKAIVYDQHGAPEVLKLLEQCAVPKRKRKELLIKVAYAGVNPIDCKLRQKKMPSLLLPKPKIPGAEIIGVVVDSDAESRFKVGVKVMSFFGVFGHRYGGYAEYVVVKEKDAVLAPSAWPDSALAGASLVGLTCLQAFAKISDHQQPLKGKTILIHAGAGGLGSMAIGLAKHQQFKVMTTCSPHHNEWVKSLGADQIIDYNTTNFEDVVRSCDVVFDPIGGDVLARTIKADVLSHGGDYLHIINGKEKWLQLMPVIARLNIKARFRPGPHWAYVLAKPKQTDLLKLANLIDQQAIKPMVDRIWSLCEAQAAHTYLEQGHATGKVILAVS